MSFLRVDSRNNLKWMLRSLRSRNYRLFFFGYGLSLIGSWMTLIARAWLAYRLTQSPFLLGLIGFLGQIPNFFLAPIAGVLLERWDRRKVIIFTQFTAMTLALTLSLLFFAGWLTFPLLALISLLQGLNNSFDMPARQTFVVEMVEKKEDLGSAIALNSTLVNGSRMIGPSVGGLMIAAFGEGICFLLDGLSYIFILASLFAMRIEGRKKEERKRKIWPELKEGFRYVLDSPVIRSALLMVALISVMGMPYTVLMPIFATKVLHGGPHALGFLMAAIGVGALGGGFFLASFRSGERLGKVIAAAAGVFGCGLIAFSLSRSLFLSLGLLLFAGFGMMVGTAGSNTLLQTVVEDDKRARVMSFYALAFMGMAPIGSLLSGSLANWIGAPATVGLGGVSCILASLFYAGRLSRANSSCSG